MYGNQGGYVLFCLPRTTAAMEVKEVTVVVAITKVDMGVKEDMEVAAIKAATMTLINLATVATEIIIKDIAEITMAMDVEIVVLV